MHDEEASVRPAQRRRCSARAATRPRPVSATSNPARTSRCRRRPPPTTRARRRRRRGRPRLRRPTGTTPRTTTSSSAATPPIAGDTGVDISGPCDEAEHADDPRCTGAAAADDDDDDRSGSNSGRSATTTTRRHSGRQRRRRPLRLELRQGLRRPTTTTTTTRRQRHVHELALLALLALARERRLARRGRTRRERRADGPGDREELLDPPLGEAAGGHRALQVPNVSDDAHDFWIRGGGKTWKTRMLGESRTAALTATLQARAFATRSGARSSDHRQDGMSGSFVAR